MKNFFNLELGPQLQAKKNLSSWRILQQEKKVNIYICYRIKCMFDKFQARH